MLFLNRSFISLLEILEIFKNVLLNFQEEEKGRGEGGKR